MNINIYFGEWPRVLHGRLVTIENYQHMQCVIDVPNELNDIKSHVISFLGINQFTHKVILVVVRPRFVPNGLAIIYTLLKLRRNNAWALYMCKAVEENFDIGVYVNILPRMMSKEAEPSGDVFGHEENEGEVGEGSSGAPTGEVHLAEVDAGCMDDEGGKSEDEHAADSDDPTPAIQYFRAAGLLDCTVVDYSHISVWGYQNSDIQIEQLLCMKEKVIYFISNFAVTTRREHNCTWSELRAYEVRCNKYPDCSFFVRAHMPRHENYFVITRYTPHACSEEPIRNMSRIVNARLIAQLIVTLVGSDIGLSPKSIMEEVHMRTGMAINYHMAWKAKQKSMKMLFGSFEESFNYAPRLLQKISIMNPGTQWAMVEEPVILQDSSSDTGSRYLIRIFWSFGQCIEAFRYCRPVLCVDGTFLSGKYHATLLTAIVEDANNQILLIAFAYVESENNDSWLWFLTLLRTHVVRNREHVCIILDCNAGLLHALDVLHDSTNPSVAWPDVE
jgi:hypothetical protein